MARTTDEIFDKIENIEQELIDGRTDVALVADSLTTLAQQLGYFSQQGEDHLLSAVRCLNDSTVVNRKKAVKAVKAAKTELQSYMDAHFADVHQHIEDSEDRIVDAVIPKMLSIVLAVVLFVVVFIIVGHISYNYDLAHNPIIGNVLDKNGAIVMKDGAPVPAYKWDAGDMWRHAIAFGTLAGSIVLMLVYGVATFIKRITRNY